MTIFDPLPLRGVDVHLIDQTLIDPVDYFGVARARWARDRDILVKDCWFVAYLVLRRGTPLVRLINTRFEFTATDQQVHSRFRHPTGRLFYYEETPPVVNTLNKMPLSILAARQTVGGLTRLVHQISREVLGVK